MKTTTTKKEKTMTKLFISGVEVIQGDLYEVWGEDSKLVVFDTIVQAIVDGDIYHHNHVFKGVVQDPEGFEHPNMNAVNSAKTLANRVSDAGMINTEHWICVGNLSEIEDPLVRLEREWSSDHY
jgi:hypothetical protein